MENQTIVFAAPGVVEIQKSPVRTPGDNEVVVRLARSTISSGTENLISPRMGLPWVMSCTPKKVLIRDVMVICIVLIYADNHFLL